MGRKHKCKVGHCPRKYHLKGYCRIHLRAYEEFGDPYHTTEPKRSMRKKITFSVNENGCFVNESHAHHGFGYNRITIDGKLVGMHRFIYKEMFGDIPERMVVRHKCDNPRCINPEHLELGTVLDNNRDVWERGRENITTRKFDENQIIDILRRISSGEQQKEIAESYGVSLSTINHIKTGRNYKRIIEAVRK